MGWSNIYCQIIGVAGPILGEGLLHGFETSIELDSFKWDAKVQQTQDELTVKASGGMSNAPKTSNPLRGVERGIECGNLTIEKRFDIASSEMHTMLDLGAPLVTVSITVLHIAHSKGAIHQPGFVLLAANCKLVDCTVTMDKGDGNGVDVKETWTIEFKVLTITYLKSFGDNQIPMPPFVYVKPTDTASPAPV